MAESQGDIRGLIEGLSEEGDQLQQVTAWISYYDHELSKIQKYASEIETENAALQVETTNRLQLAQYAQEMIEVLDLSPEMEKALQSSVEQMASEKGLEAALQAAAQLQRRLQTEFPP